VVTRSAAPIGFPESFREGSNGMRATLGGEHDEAGDPGRLPHRVPHA